MATAGFYLCSVYDFIDYSRLLAGKTVLSVLDTHSTSRSSCLELKAGSLAGLLHVSICQSIVFWHLVRIVILRSHGRLLPIPKEGTTSTFHISN